MCWSLAQISTKTDYNLRPVRTERQLGEMGMLHLHSIVSGHVIGTAVTSAQSLRAADTGMSGMHFARHCIKGRSRQARVTRSWLSPPSSVNLENAGLSSDYADTSLPT